MIKSFPTIYSLTSHGQTQTWMIEMQGDKFRTIEGLLDGALTTSAWTTCEPKNLGKKNETTGAEQALKEAKARHKKKLDEGYHEKVENIAVDKFFQPMLAKKWKDRKDEVEFPIYSNPKLDGRRAITKHDGMFSRTGKVTVSAPHFCEALKPFLKLHPSYVFDGELYAHKLKHDFEKIMSLANQSKPTEEDLNQSLAHLEYWIYDFCDTNNPDMPIEQRHKILKSILDKLDKSIKIIYVPLTLCKDEEELDKAYSDYLDDGMEGQIIRIVGSPYENKRSNNLLKRKEFIDEEFELVDVLSGKGGHEHLASKVLCKMKNGVTFEAGMIGSHEYCAALLKNKKKIIGQMATIVFQNYTEKEKVPRFGKCKGIRDE